MGKVNVLQMSITFHHGAYSNVLSSGKRKLESLNGRKSKDMEKVPLESSSSLIVACSPQELPHKGIVIDSEWTLVFAIQGILDFSKRYQRSRIQSLPQALACWIEEKLAGQSKI
jgi:hypothetical protein